MLPRPAPASQPSLGETPAPTPPARVGIGIDTSRYGHYAAFLRDDLQPAAAELQFAESPAGYAQLRQRLEHIAQRYVAQGHGGGVHFVIRLDAAGQYADNLLHFLHTRFPQAPQAVQAVQAPLTRRADAAPLAQASASDTAPFFCSLSCGDPQRNKNYRAALFGSQKSDPVEARAAARFALAERPGSVTPMSLQLRALRQVAGRLQAVVRQRTRLINQFHHLLALSFPELALLIKDIAAGWVLELVHRYPTAQLLAQAREDDVAAIPYLPEKHVAALLEQARSSIASLDGPTIEELVRDQVRQLRDARARQKRLENLLVAAYHALPEPNHIDTIPGIGAVTAAVLTAFIADIDRFDVVNRLVKYFGVMPIEVASGVDRDGNPRPVKRYVMSPRGNDLVRRYLWMAGLSAVRFNPAVAALYARVVAKHPKRKAVAIGHAMRKLLHLVFAIWKSGKPFDAGHYPWATPAHLDQATGVSGQAPGDQATGAKSESDMPMSQPNQAAGLKLTARPANARSAKAKPARTEVAAARTNTVAHLDPAAEIAEIAEAAAIDKTTAVDFAHLKKQLPLARVLDHLGLSSRLRGPGQQRRGACPIHRGDERGRTFSVHLGDNVFQCFDKACGKKGDVIDLWANVNGMSLREAALDLVRTFHIEPAPPTNARKGTEKRHG